MSTLQRELVEYQACKITGVANSRFGKSIEWLMIYIEWNVTTQVINDLYWVERDYPKYAIDEGIKKRNEIKRSLF